MNTKFWTAFSSIEQLDSTFVQRLYNHFGDVETAFNATLNELKQIEGLSVKKAENFVEKKKNVNPDKTLEFIKSKNINILTFDDDRYPYMLRQISNPPMCLYYKGNLFDCNLEKTIAIVGSRKASFAGKESVNKIISNLSGTDICIVSGLASGIDAIAHKSAIENNIKTIGVIASGFDYVYPSGNKYLYEQIIDGNGAIVTEYYPTFEPIKFRFPQRNRIVTGLSYGTIVGEAAIKSGALISANLTLEQGRELMCIPGAINNINTEGIYKLLKDGATMVTSGEDVLNALNWEIVSKETSSCSKLELDFNKQKIFDIISVEPKCFDEIMTVSGLNTQELLVCLTEMELSGLIEQTDGDRYKRKIF
ncbi:MAG: DNA-processing protein DprA [bacterium]|nr:DNA-processing protein DprA [bacterium]